LCPRSTMSGSSIQDDERLLYSDGHWHRAQRKHVGFCTACGYTNEPELQQGCQLEQRLSTAWSTDSARRSDKQVLLGLFYGTGGGLGYWRATDNWSEATDPCWDHWYGVTCDEHGRVIYLELADNGLRGAMPSNIGDLTSLIKLDLSTTAPEYHSHENKFKNVLTGKISSMAACPRIEEIEISGNQIEALPDDLWRNAPTLRHLSANHNLLTALPKYLLKFAKLHTLELGHNKIKDAFPADFGKLTNMRFLQLEYNDLRGTIGRDILGMRRMRAMDLSHNPRLGGEIPKDIIVQWTEQEYISILNTTISGYLSSLCLDVPFCWKFMYDTHKDLTWATAADVPDIVQITLTLARKAAADKALAASR